jgi:hypothetical protein
MATHGVGGVQMRSMGSIAGLWKYIRKGWGDSLFIPNLR